MSTFGPGWAQIRRALLEHVADGLLTLAEYIAFITILLLADARTGKWRGSAPALTTILGCGSKNTMADALERLETKGYILRDFMPGARGNFPIIIDKFQITIGSNSGKRVDLRATKRKFGIPEGGLSKLKRKSLLAAVSAACKSPVFESETDGGHDVGDEAGYDVGDGGGSVSISYILEPRNEKVESERESEGFALNVLESGKQGIPVLHLDSVPAQDSVPVPTSAVPLAVAPAFPADVNATMSAALRLAMQFFNYQGKPRKLDTARTLHHWTTAFEQLIALYGLDDLEGALKWGFEIDAFWPPKLIRSNEPLEYFRQKLADQIMPRYRGWKTADTNKRKPTTTTTNPRKCEAKSDSKAAQTLAKKWGGKING
jgi:hypothetical protein